MSINGKGEKNHKHWTVILPHFQTGLHHGSIWGHFLKFPNHVRILPPLPIPLPATFTLFQSWGGKISQTHSCPTLQCGQTMPQEPPCLSMLKGISPFPSPTLFFPVCHCFFPCCAGGSRSHSCPFEPGCVGTGVSWEQWQQQQQWTGAFPLLTPAPMGWGQMGKPTLCPSQLLLLSVCPVKPSPHSAHLERAGVA